MTAPVSNLERYKADVRRLSDQGQSLQYAMMRSHDQSTFDDAVNEGFDPEKAKEFIKKLPSFKAEYEPWYSEASALIRQIMPDRLDDFRNHYQKPKARKELVRRRNIWRRFGVALTESGPRQGLAFRRRACGAASGDVRWSVS